MAASYDGKSGKGTTHKIQQEETTSQKKTKHWEPDVQPSD